ncbi:MAG: PIN domain-containing protein [Candidatus Shapirobacteria bacterium]|nr:PIN domain-containing protein [Candidatus Shapirobacteria bacterium]
MPSEIIDVFFDSNVLFGSPISEEVNDIIDNKDLSTKLKLNLNISEVVFWECQRHFTNTVNEALNSYNRSGKILNKFLNQKNKENKIEDKKIKSVFVDIFKKKKVKIIKVPHRKINYRDLAKNAAFYEFPFKEKEKGFRDALIVETTFHHAKNNSENRTVLISNDKNVIGFTNAKINQCKNLSIYSSIPEFISQTKLYLEELDNDFIVNVSKKSNREFYSSIYLKEDLENSLQEKYYDIFKNPDLNKTDYGFLTALSPYMDNNTVKNWSPEDKGYFSISNSEFINKNDLNQYTWKTIIVFKRRFSEEYGITDAIVPSHYVDYIIEFEAEWVSEVDESINFSNIKLIKVILLNKRVKDVSSFDFIRQTVQSTLSGMATLPVYDLGSMLNNAYKTTSKVFSSINESVNSLSKIREITSSLSSTDRNYLKGLGSFELPRVNRDKKSNLDLKKY